MLWRGDIAAVGRGSPSSIGIEEKAVKSRISDVTILLEASRILLSGLLIVVRHIEIPNLDHPSALWKVSDSLTID